MLRDHPLTKLVISEGGFPEVVSLSALRRPLTDVIVQIHWRLGTGPIGSARIVQGVKVETIGSSRLPDQVLRWKYPWGHISELEELVEQTAWSLGGAYLERFAKAPYSGEQPYTAPGAGLRPSFCGLGKCYSFPGLGEASIGQMDNEDLMEEAARMGIGRGDSTFASGCTRPTRSTAVVSRIAARKILHSKMTVHARDHFRAGCPGNPSADTAVNGGFRPPRNSKLTMPRLCSYRMT